MLGSATIYQGLVIISINLQLSTFHELVRRALSTALLKRALGRD